MLEMSCPFPCEVSVPSFSRMIPGCIMVLRFVPTGQDHGEPADIRPESVSTLQCRDEACPPSGSNPDDSAYGATTQQDDTTLCHAKAPPLDLES
jgi:hypothetical protein